MNLYFESSSFWLSLIHHTYTSILLLILLFRWFVQFTNMTNYCKKYLHQNEHSPMYCVALLLIIESFSLQLWFRIILNSLANWRQHCISSNGVMDFLLLGQDACTDFSLLLNGNQLYIYLIFSKQIETFSCMIRTYFLNTHL